MADAVFRIEWKCGGQQFGVDIKIDNADKVDSEDFHKCTLVPALTVLQDSIDRKRGVPTRHDKLIAEVRQFLDG